MQEKMYYKIWFNKGGQRTAGLVLNTETYPLETSVAEYSRLYSYFEASKMARFHRSPMFHTWQEAFDYVIR